VEVEDPEMREKTMKGYQGVGIYRNVYSNKELRVITFQGKNLENMQHSMATRW